MLLLVWSALTALGWNLLSPWGIPLTRGGIFDIAAEQGGWLRISLLDAKDFFEQGAIFIDARPMEEQKTGTIRGALSLPADELETVYPEFEMKVLGMGGGPGPMNMDHVVFCTGGTCTDSVVVADWLTEIGYERVWVMEEGYDTWLAQSLPVEVPLEEEF